jgi:hypothetical protein
MMFEEQSWHWLRCGFLRSVALSAVKKAIAKSDPMGVALRI